MNIKQIREKENITSKQFAQVLEIDRKALNYIEDKTLLPTVILMDKIESLLNIDRLELYDKKELRLLKRKNTKHSVSADYEYYNFHVRLDRKYKPLFSKEALRLINSGTLNHWFEKEVIKLARRLKNTIERKIKKDPLFDLPEELKVLLNELFGSTFNIANK